VVQRRRRLGVLLSGFCVVLGLLGGCRAEAQRPPASDETAEKIEATRRLLTELAEDVRLWSMDRGHVFGKALVREQDGTLGTCGLGFAITYGRYLRDGHVIVDAWKHPLVIFLPGRIHENGFDLYSVGPNGRDERGRGDDILFEGVAAVGSRN
jgi:hypothetical protein